MLVYSMQHVAMQAPHCQEFLDFVQTGKKTQKKSEEVSVARSTPHEIRFEHVSFSYPGQRKACRRGCQSCNQKWGTSCNCREKWKWKIDLC